MNDQNSDDRRQNPRIEKHYVVTYYDISFPKQTYCTTQLKNISCGGMRMITELPFSKGAILDIKIKSPFFVNIAHLQAEVLESHEMAKNIFYHTRLQFIDLSPEAKEAINQNIKFFENQSDE